MSATIRTEPDLLEGDKRLDARKYSRPALLISLHRGFDRPSLRHRGRADPMRTLGATSGGGLAEARCRVEAGSSEPARLGKQKRAPGGALSQELALQSPTG